jgi:hypothetical protein
VGPAVDPCRLVGQDERAGPRPAERQGVLVVLVVEDDVGVLRQGLGEGARLDDLAERPRAELAELRAGLRREVELESRVEGVAYIAIGPSIVSRSPSSGR